MTRIVPSHRTRVAGTSFVLFTAAAAFSIAGCARMGFDSTAILPPPTFAPTLIKISESHVTDTVVSGTCTEIGGTVEVSGDAEGATTCMGDGTWAVALDFSRAADGVVTLLAMQRSAAGNHTSPVVEHQYLKDTLFCADASRVAAAPFAGGSGTVDDPYVICSGAQLDAVRGHLDAHLRLQNDVDLGDAVWSPFGTLTGTFDGNGFRIENLILRNDSYPTGLFGDANGTIRDLGVVNVSSYTYCHVGAVVGILNAGGTVERCYATGVVQSYSDAVGGLVGENTGTILDSFAVVDTTDTGSYCVGGLVGNNDPAGVIERSYARGHVVAFAADRVGGLVGCNDGAIRDTYALGGVIGTTGGSNIGGLVGKNTGTVERSFAIGSVSGDPAGALVACNAGEVTASYWDADACANATSDGGSALSGDAMCESQSFVGWDFDAVWQLDLDRASHPLLGWE